MSEILDEMGRAKEHLLLESLGWVEETECLLSKGSQSSREKAHLGQYVISPSIGKYCYSGVGLEGYQETSQSHWI